MRSINHAGKHGAPSVRGCLPAAWSRQGLWTNLVRSTRSNYNSLPCQMGRNNPPLVRQFLLLFGEGDEASPPGIEGDFRKLRSSDEQSNRWQPIPPTIC